MIPPTGTEDPNNTGIAPQDASDFIDFLKSRVGCGYVLGTYGQICTQQLLEIELLQILKTVLHTILVIVPAGWGNW